VGFHLPQIIVTASSWPYVLVLAAGGKELEPVAKNSFDELSEGWRENFLPVLLWAVRRKTMAFREGRQAAEVGQDDTPELLCVLFGFLVQLCLQDFFVLREPDDGVFAFYGADDFGETLAWRVLVMSLMVHVWALLTFVLQVKHAKDGSACRSLQFGLLGLNLEN
jgi:hypothetical protein